MTAIIVWILGAVALAQAVFATRAYLIEKREGLPRSSLRIGLSIAIAVATIGLGVYTQLAGRASTPTAQALRQHDKAEQAKIADLEQQLAKLDEQRAKLAAELDKLDPHVAPAAPTEPSTWPMLAALALALAGFGVLLMGDPATLLPKKSKPTEPTAPEQVPGQPAEPLEPATLANLSAHAQAGRWNQALGLAARISIEKLHKLEQLDLLFLRAYCQVASVAAPEDGKALGEKDKTARLAAATKDLERLRELAPHMAEARWLAGYLRAQAGEWQPALDEMRAAAPELDVERNFARDESACLLMLAEQKLAAADNDGATKLFDEVTKLGALADQIPVAMVTHRILTVRGHIKGGKFAEAADGIARIRQVGGLDQAAQRATSVACDVYEVAIQFRSGEHQRALEATHALFSRWLPAKLPDVEDQAADEFLLPAIDKDAIALPPELYRGLFFLEAVARVELASRKARRLAPEEIEAIGTALLRALQFQPRHRESLAALAALYLAYRPERTEKALAWLDAALTMGVRSPRAKNLLIEARRAERERKELLAMFRAASGRFLADPAVSVAVRKALIEELGRFDEFRPVVLELQEAGALDAPAREITVTALRERAAFVGGVASEVVRRADPAATGKLTEIHRELTALANNVDTSATRIAALERAVMEQLGRIVLR